MRPAFRLDVIKILVATVKHAPEYEEYGPSRRRQVRQPELSNLMERRGIILKKETETVTQKSSRSK